MNLKKFLSLHDRAHIEDVCIKAGTTYDYLRWQLGGGHRKVSTNLAQRLVKAAPGDLTLHELRPDVWDKATA